MNDSVYRGCSMDQTQVSDPSTICLKHQAIEQQLKSITVRQTRSEKRIDGIQESIVKLRVSHAKVVGTGTALLAVLQLLLKFLPTIIG